MNVFAAFGLLFCVAGILMFVIWSQECLADNVPGPNDKYFILGMTFMEISTVLIVAWLFMRATGFNLGYLLSLFAIIGGIYYGYLADMASSQAKYGDLISKKYIFLVAGFIIFVIVAIAATS